MSDKAGRILFACNMNSVRSPMAEALAREMLGPDIHVESCGVYEGILDPYVARVLDEAGIPVPSRDPQSFGRLDVNGFDVVVALTSKAAAEARKLGANVEFWDTANPTDIRDGEEQMLKAYRACRDELKAKIDERFGAGASR